MSTNSEPSKEPIGVSDPIAAFSETIKKQRESKGLTQQELASLLACHPTFIAKLERLKPDGPLPSFSRTAAMEETLDFKPGELWKKVLAAKTQMEHHKLMIRNQEIQRAIHRQGLNLTNLPALPAMGKVDKGHTLDSDTVEAIEAMREDLELVMQDPEKRSLVNIVVHGLAEEIRQTREH